tara:strand:+ start:1641 stop:1991 length:351 start_codon:yes stop_codon:yes gene_type:complete
MGCIHSVDKTISARNKLGDNFTLTHTTQIITFNFNKCEIISVQGHLILFKSKPHYFIIDSLNNRGKIIYPESLQIEIIPMFCCTPMIDHPSSLADILNNTKSYEFILDSNTDSQNL